MEGSTNANRSGRPGHLPRQASDVVPFPASQNNSGSSASTTPKSVESPRDSRIPRPKTTASTSPLSEANRRQAHKMRQPLSLGAAFKLAEEQDADEQQGGAISLRQAFNMASAEANQAIDASPSPAPRTYRSRGNPNNNELHQHLRHFDREHRLDSPTNRSNALFSKTRIGTKVAETGHALAKKASDSSLGSSPGNRNSRNPDWKRNTASTSEDAANSAQRGKVDQDDPLPSVEDDGPDQDSPVARPANLSPEKSFGGWHLDTDFTAGDIQISDSPRITRHPQAASDSLQTRRGNDKLDQICEREIEAAKTDLSEIERLHPRRTNTRLDEIRAREIEALSRRAVATSRLDEIRVRNSEARSASPEIRMNGSILESRSGSVPLGDTSRLSEMKAFEQIGEEKHDHESPAATSKDSSNEKKDQSAIETRVENEKPTLPSRDDSHELLGRLARATSSSPPLREPASSMPGRNTTPDAVPPNRDAEDKLVNHLRLAKEERRSRVQGAKGPQERLIVGLAGHRRNMSGDSMKGKRSSLGNSDVDPTDRIEAEMSLFEPQETHSERGSTRPPSPDRSEPPDDETPRPSRIDPLTQPTPRVTGAYVETPSTVKVEKSGDMDTAPPEKGLLEAPDIKIEGGVKDSGELRRVQSFGYGEKEADKKSTASSSRSLSLSSAASSRGSHRLSSRRSRSVPRRRSPLINTAQPPSVKDDIRAILRSHHIEDSTLDDFDELLSTPDLDLVEVEKVVHDTVLQAEESLDVPDLDDRERELQAYDRMSKSLRTGLQGIRSAKLGIERLEDKVSHSEHKSLQAAADLEVPSAKRATHLPTPLSDATAIRIPTPLIFQRRARFGLTKFGLLFLLSALWYTLESVFCFFCVAPRYECTVDEPCDWSPNEPYFPYAMPFMLDEWAAGGRGRELVWRLGEELGDAAAECSDWATGNDFTADDPRYMDVWERKRHRRRLRKKGLLPKWEEPPDYKAKFAHWRAAREANEHAMQAREMGWEFAGDETLGDDENL